MKIISIAQVIVSILLIISILMQSRGSGLGGAFGSGGMESFHSKRGFEKFLTNFSIGLAFLFIALALLNVIVASNA